MAENKKSKQFSWHDSGWERVNRKVFERENSSGNRLFDTEDVYKDPTGKYYKVTGTSRDMGLSASKSEFDIQTFAAGVDSSGLERGSIIKMSPEEFDEYMNPKPEKTTEDKIINSWLKKAKGLFGG